MIAHHLKGNIPRNIVYYVYIKQIIALPVSKA